MLFCIKAEEGIGYSSVTGVQTCALPISSTRLSSETTNDSPSFYIPVSKFTGRHRFRTARAKQELGATYGTRCSRPNWSGKWIHVLWLRTKMKLSSFGDNAE